MRSAVLRRITCVTAGLLGSASVDPHDTRIALAARGLARSEIRRAALVARGMDEHSKSGREAADQRLHHSEALCQTKAVSYAGHQARALAFCFWDDGDLAKRAANQGYLEERLIWAVVADLAGLR